METVKLIAYYAAISLTVAAALATLLHFLVSLGWPGRARLGGIGPVAYDLDAERPRRRITGRDFAWVVMVFVASRLFVLIASYMGALLFGPEGMTALPGPTELWNRWDAPHYLSIARHGYQSAGDDRFFIVFFPLYPLLVRGISLIVGNFFSAAIVCSCLCLLGACWILFAFVSDTHGKQTARRTVLFLLFAPFSFFMGFGFTESLFLLVTVAAVFAAWRGKWLIAGLCGLFAALTRSQGILLSVPMGILFLTALTGRLPQAAKPRPRDLLCFFGIPVGIGLYLFVNQWVFGDPFHFMIVQREHWSQRFGFFADTIRNNISEMLWRGPAMAISLWLPQILAFFAAMALVIYGCFRQPPGLSAYLLAFTLMSYSPTWLLSGNRYLSTAFPIYIFLAALTRKKTAFAIVLAGSAGLLMFYTVAFVRGQHVM